MLQPFPVARFTHYGDFRYYYAYGNTPAEDFLESITEINEPAVLLLGCGDIRSCFYTLWKNFNPQNKRHFSSVHFVLNDVSAAVLARNIIFLYLCLQMPKEKEDVKKWIAALWSIWYCHELLPEHKRVLKDALTNLLRWSGSTESWSKNLANPLRSIVKFASPNTLCKIQKVWNMWLHETISIRSVEEMKLARKEVVGSKLEDHSNPVMLMKFFGELLSDIPVNQQNRIEAELSNYFQCGCAFVENVLQLPFASTKTFVNLTFFERADGQYSLHYRLTPYLCFFQTFQFSSEQLRMNGVSVSDLNHLVVEDQQFSDHPLLANSVQQFAIWLSASAKLLSQCLTQESPHISFTLQCSDAVEFCQQMHHDPNSFATHLGFEPIFDAIHSSNLSDHVGPPNLVLTAVQLLKENSNLFTSTFLYRDIDVAAEKYLEATFGFEPMLLPLLCGVRCIGHEGKYASSVPIQFTPRDGTSALYPIMLCTKLLIWQRVSMLPFKVTVLDKDSSVLKALTDSVVMVLTSYFSQSLGRRIIPLLCTETVLHILLAFASRMDVEVDINSHQYWKPFCSRLQDQQQLKPFLMSLQTQALLHGLHFHLTVSELNCPMCTGRPVSDYISQFSVVLTPSKLRQTPSFSVFIHKLPHDVVPDSFALLTASSSGADVHIIDSVAGSHTEGSVKLDFFAPQYLASENYRITVNSMAGATMEQTVLMQGKLSDCSGPTASFMYFFERTETVLRTSKSMFGTFVKHFGDGDKMESILSLSESTMSALKLHKLDTKVISEAKIEVVCADLGTEISYPYPVDYGRIVVRLSRKNRTVTVIAPRRIQLMYEEKPTFIVMPDNTLSLPPMLISEKVTDIYCGLQFTMEDRAIIRQLCSWSKPAEVNLKQSMKVLFTRSNGNFLCLRYPDGIFCGLFLIHNRVFDTQKKSPAIDLSFCFPDIPTFSHIAPHWLKVAPFEICTIEVDVAEFELLKKVFYHFAQCTFTTSKKPYGRMPLLSKDMIDQYFTRAVVYPLYADQDAITKFLNHLQPFSAKQSETQQQSTLQQSSGKVPQDESGTAISPQRKSQISNEGGNDSKCSYCCSQSDLKKCSRCGEAQYCGQDCQKKHWKEHKLICNPQRVTHPNTQTVTTASPVHSQEKLEGAMKEGGNMQCSFCGIQPTALKKCSRCGEAQYCGQSCQRKHWKEHKLVCGIQKESHFDIQTSRLPTASRIAQNIAQHKCEGCEKEFSSLRKCQCRQVAYCSVECQRKDWQKHKDMCTVRTPRRRV